MRPTELVAAISRHLDEVEVRVRKSELRDYDFASMRLHLEGAQAKLAGVLALLAHPEHAN